MLFNIALLIVCSLALSAEAKFDAVDVTAWLDTSDGQVQLEAFKAASNDSLQYWASIGNPTLVKLPNKNANPTVFQSTPDGFYVLVTLLGDRERQALADAASIKHGVAVTPGQIQRVLLSKFDCTLNLHGDEQRYVIKGEVEDFYKYPLRVDFDAPPGTKERRLFDQLGGENVAFECELAAHATVSKQQTLSIPKGLSVLFSRHPENASTVYVTREQLKLLASSLYWKLNVLEQYGLSLHRFAQKFVDDFVTLTATKTFGLQPFETTIAALSYFGVAAHERWLATEVKNALGALLRVSSVDSKQVITVNTETAPDTADAEANSRLTLFPIGASIAFAKTSYQRWLRDGDSLPEQLRQLNANAAAQGEFEWKIEDTRLLPHAVNVAIISKQACLQTLTFRRVKRIVYDHLFSRKVRFVTNKTVEYSVRLREQIANLTRLVHSYMQASLPVGAVVSNVGDVPQNWLVCDGQAVSRSVYGQLFHTIGTTYGAGDSVGTFNVPDLRGRVVLGVDTEAVRLQNASSAGSSGGNAVHVLSVAQLPGHSHSAGSLKADAAGLHTHDVVDPGHNHGGVTGSSSGTSLGSQKPHDMVNARSTPDWLSHYTHAHSIPTGTVGISIVRDGDHVHSVSGSTQSVGEDQSFPVLPPFLASQYIIFAGSLHEF